MDPTAVDRSNYQYTLTLSSAGRAGAPDGNVFFNTATGIIELITREELATVRLPKANAGVLEIVVDATAGTFTRSSGSFLTDGFAAGQQLRSYGFANAGNNTTKIIDSVTATVITVTDETGLVDETRPFARLRSFGDLEDNPLTNHLGVTKAALYAFENQERQIDDNVRGFFRYVAGKFIFGGAYELVNGRKYDTATSSVGDDRRKIRGSGWTERAANNAVDRIYFGARSLNPIEEDSRPYYQLEPGGEGFDFNRLGPVDEAIQVFGSTANGDTGAGNFDLRAFLSTRLRTFGFLHDEKTLVDSGIDVMDGYSAGFALGEAPHPTTGDFDVDDVYGPTQKGPWTGVTLEKLASPQTEGGFNEADGDFSWVLHNDLSASGVTIANPGADYEVNDILTVTGGTVRFGRNATLRVTSVGAGGEVTGIAVEFAGAYTATPANPASVTGGAGTGATFTLAYGRANLNQMTAYLDAIAAVDADIDEGAETTTLGRRVGTWYSFQTLPGEQAARLVTRSGGMTGSPLALDGLGLFIENVPTADEQRIAFTADDGSLKTRPFFVEVRATVGSVAASDPFAWFEAFIAATFDTATPETLLDADGNPVRGFVNGLSLISWAHDYDGNTQGEGPGEDRDIVFQCEGNGIAAQARVNATITRQAIVAFVAAPPLDEN